MKKPAVASAGLDLDFNNSNLGPSAGEQQSPQSQPVLDLDQQAILNMLDTASESNSRPSQKTNPHPSGFDEMRQENRRVSASITDQQCLTGTLLGLHRQGQRRGWNAQHYQRIAEAHWDRYPMGYWLWMHCARGVQ